MTLPTHLEQLDGLKHTGAGWVARCPTHEDRNPSLSLTITDDGKVLAHCHAGCDQAALAEALDLRADRGTSAEWTPRGEAIAVYHYVDENGELLFDVCRTADKQFPQRRPDPSAKSGWRWSLGDTRRIPYRLPELLEAIRDGRSVMIAEGEKDVEALRVAGRVATCNPGGAGKWRAEYAAHFVGASVTICADKDTPGQAHARAVAASLERVADAIWIVEAADPHKDVSAHLTAGLPLSEMTVTHRPDVPAKPDLAPDIYEVLTEPEPDYDWIVPGLLERGERFMLTGWEGLGKSEWLRMISVCLAAGIHPVDFVPAFEPRKVLVIDCENTPRQIRRAYRPIVEQANAVARLPIGGLRLIRRPEGVNLPHPDGAAWLLERVTAHKPDVLVIGPLYRLHLDNPNDESTARKVTEAIDMARIESDCAVLLEAHAGHGEWGKNRSVRPVGSSLYLRWPEYGYGMRPAESELEAQRPQAVDLVGWRGPRDERNWPMHLEYGSRQNSPWPWVPTSTELRRVS